MLKTVKVIYANGVLTPLEPLDLVKHTECRAILDYSPGHDRPDPNTLPSAAAVQVSKAAAGAWVGMHDDPEELIRSLYADRLANSRMAPEV